MWVCAKIINHPKWLIMKCHWVLHVLGPLGTPSMTHNHQNQSIWGQNFHHFTIYLRAAWGKNKDPESYSNIVRPSLAIWGSHLHVSQIEIIKKTMLWGASSNFLHRGTPQVWNSTWFTWFILDYYWVYHMLDHRKSETNSENDWFLGKNRSNGQHSPQITYGKYLYLSFSPYFILSP